MILINYNPSCMSVRYSTPHVHYLQLNPSRVCLPTNFQKFKCHIFICICVCQYLWIIKFLEWAYRKKTGDMRGYFHRLGYWGFIIRLILLRFSFIFYINQPPFCQYDETINDCHTSGRFDPPFSFFFGNSCTKSGIW